MSKRFGKLLGEKEMKVEKLMFVSHCESLNDLEKQHCDPNNVHSMSFKPTV